MSSHPSFTGGPPPHPTPATSTLTERHYTIKELVLSWHCSRDTIRRRFEHEDGVIIIYTPRRGKRRYRLILIPESVALRVYSRFQMRGGRRAS